MYKRKISWQTRPLLFSDSNPTPPPGYIPDDDMSPGGRRNRPRDEDEENPRECETTFFLFYFLFFLLCLKN